MELNETNIATEPIELTEAIKLDRTKLDKYAQIVVAISILIKTRYYAAFGIAPTIKYIALVFCIMLTSVATEVLYNVFFNKKSLKESIDILKTSVPLMNAMAIAIVINFGYTISSVIICTFLGIFFAKMLFGGQKKNIFNASAFTMVLLHTGYPRMLENSSMNGFFDNVLLKSLHVAKPATIVGISNLKNNFSIDIFKSLSYSVVFFLLAFLILCIVVQRFNVVTVAPPIATMVFLFIMTYSFSGFLNGTVYMSSDVLQSYSLFENTFELTGRLGHFINSIAFYLQIVSGATILGIIFVQTDPYTLSDIPTVNYICSFIIAFTIFYTKLFTGNSFGVFFGIVLANAATPMLNNKLKSSKRQTDFSLIFLVAISLTTGFLAFWLMMKGV